MLLDFDECFYSTPREIGAAEQLVLLMAEKICRCFLSSVPLLTFSSAHMFGLQQGISLKPAQEENGFEEKERGQKKRRDDGWFDNEEKAEGGLEGENKYICLICMQAFQLLKLSISPVAIPMRVLDRQEMSCTEYQVAVHVHISTQRIAAYMRTHTHTHECSHANHAQNT